MALITNPQYAVVQSEPRFSGSRSTIQLFNTEKEMTEWLEETFIVLHDHILAERGIQLTVTSYENTSCAAHQHDFEMGTGTVEPAWYAFDCYKIHPAGRGICLSVAWERREETNIHIKPLNFLTYIK